MLSNEKIQENRSTIIELLTSTERNNIGVLIERLDANNFFTQAASTRYHQNYRGGLAEHSLEVCCYLLEMNDQLNLGFRRDSIIISSILHDLCKFDSYIELNDKFTYNNKAIKGDAAKSVKIAKQFIKLTEEEESAIRYHMGAYEKAEFNWNELGDAYKKHAMAYYIHVADMRSTYNF